MIPTPTLARALLLFILPLATPACGPTDADADPTGYGGGGGAGGAGGDDGGGGAGGGAPAPGPDDQRPDDAPDRPFVVRFDGYFGDYDVADDGTVPYVWGWQGGTMIQPRVDFPDDAGYAEGDTVRVRFRVDPEPGTTVDLLPDARETILDMQLYGGGDRPLTTSSIELQVGWDALDGVRLRLRVDVEGVDHVFDRTVELVLEQPGQDQACGDFTDGLGGPGCVYADLPGQITLDALEPADPDADPCAVIDYTARGAFSPDPGAAACFATSPITDLFADEQTITFRASAACLDENHVFLGGALPVRANTLIQGTCNPLPELTPSVSADACDCR